jgi:methyltransferase of ATP-grasp peptide maturase system
MATHVEVERTARRLRGRLVRAMSRSGVLTDDRWRAAFTEVPRHVFLPRFFRPVDHNRWAAVDASDPAWLARVYADRVLVTQLDGDPDRWATARRDGPLPGTPTSSSSMPTIMAVMLEALEVTDGQQVLEIGTGSGYNAALLCHRLGVAAVSTVDIDAGVSADASEHLAACGYHPRCAVTDGVDGYPAMSPYDRVLCTCAVSTVPLAWLAQTKPGGLVVTTLNRPLGAGLVRIIVGEGPCGRGRVLADDGRFMPLRAHRRPVDEAEAARLVDATGASRRTDLAVSAVVSPTSPFEFFAGLDLGGVVAVAVDNETVLLLHPDGSWARHRTRRGRFLVTQGGPRMLWDDAEKAYAQWHELGQPRRARFGITVDPHTQELWLDRPDSPYRWPLA